MSQTFGCPGCPGVSHPPGRTPFCYTEALKRTISGGVLGVLGDFRNIAGAHGRTRTHAHSQNSFSKWMGHPGHPSQTAATIPESGKLPSSPGGGTPQDTQDTTPDEMVDSAAIENRNGGTPQDTQDTTPEVIR